MAEKTLKTAAQYAEAIVRELEAREMTISFAESCTGGLLAATIVGVSGASHVFRESYVTYCDESKRDLLCVPQKALDRYTAVSKEVACQMAFGAMHNAKSDVAVSVTGYADGEDAGHVFVAVTLRIKNVTRCLAKELHLTGDRNQVRKKTVRRALKLLWNHLG